MPYLFACIGGAARAVHTQNKSLHVFVLADFLEHLHHVFAYDAVARLVGYLAFQINHRHFVFGFRLGTFHQCQLAGRQQVVILGAGINAQQRIHVLCIHNSIHQTGFHLLFCFLQTHITVGKGVQFCYGQMTGSTYRALELVPDTAQIFLRLLAVGVRHRRAEERLHSTLERAHFEDLHLHAHFL